MTIHTGISHFHGLKLRHFSEGDSLDGAADHAWRIGIDEQDDPDEPLVDDFLGQPNVGEVRALVIGMWNTAYESSALPMLKRLIESGRLGNLEALFIGEMTSEECEISWINHDDYGRLLNGLPKLRHLQIRGGTGLRLEGLALPALETLIVESGGLGAATVGDIARADLPALKRLDLWLGVDDYGRDGDGDAIDAILRQARLPALAQLGLMNTDIVDDLAGRALDWPLAAALKTLDLSYGVLTDAGADALLAHPRLRTLGRLLLEHVFLSDDRAAALSAAVPDVEIENLGPDPKQGRYVLVAE